LEVGLQLECVNKMFISPSIWAIPVDTSVKWGKNRNLALGL